MALIKLTGKYAVGPHEYAIVDDDMVDYLSQWRWKAKPNGKRNNVYAVRNARVDGKHITIRMHRVVAGLDASNPLDTDHENHNSLDNRRENLVAATRQQNILNARRIVQSGSCKHCGVAMNRVISACANGSAMACEPCQKSKVAPYTPHSAVFFVACKQCGASVTARGPGRVFCTDTCRCRFRLAQGYVHPARREKRAARVADGAACTDSVRRVLEMRSRQGGSEDSRKSTSAEF